MRSFSCFSLNMTSNGKIPDWTILVTGGAGFIGSHTILELLTAGYNVIAIDNCVNCAIGNDQTNKKPPSITRVEELTGRNVIFYEISTLDIEALTNLFKKHEIDLVIHFAALKAVGESMKQPLQYYHNNINGTLTLLEAVNKFGVKNLVYSSSATVYGTPEYLPMDEDHPTGKKITNPYGQTKYMCEQILKDLTKADKSWRVIILRYFNPVGAHDSGMIGEDPQGVPSNLMPFISQVAVGVRQIVKVFGADYDTPDGTGIRDYIHVVDLAKGHVSSLEKLLSPEFRGLRIYNLGTGRGVSVLEMINAFSQVSGKEIPFEITGRRPGDLSKVVASCDLARVELNWVAEKGLVEMCEDTWRWQKNNPRGYSGEEHNRNGTIETGVNNHDTPKERNYR